MHIYLHDPMGVIEGPVTLPEVPGLGVQLPSNAVVLQEALPAPKQGFAWGLVEGEPMQLPDYRGVVYDTERGQELQHSTLGDLPPSLTTEPKPGAFYSWNGSNWALDEPAKLEHEAASERVWRDSEVASSEWLVTRHRDEQDMHRETTLTVEQFAELLNYRQALRDWPQSEGFPISKHRPVAMTWIADQIQ